MEGRTYLASDLAAELGLPRSTINDWLMRYADYLEVETRGKRKVYSARSLRILKEIAEMRNDGKNSFEIEQLLTARYGIRPEVSAPPPVSGEQAEEEEEKEETLPAAVEGGAVATRPAFEQMTLQINTEFLKLASRLEEAERIRRRLVQRMWAITAAVIVGLALLLLVLGLVMYQMLGRLEKKNHETAETINREAGLKFGEISVVLDGSRQDFQENIVRLKEELAAQRKAFDEKLKEMEANSATRAEAQILRFKEEFAHRQQEELKRIEELRKTVRETAAAQLEAVREEARKREEAAKLAAEQRKAEEAPRAKTEVAAQPKPQAAKPEVPKTEAPKAEAPKAEVPKAEVPKPETTK